MSKKPSESSAKISLRRNNKIDALAGTASHKPGLALEARVEKHMGISIGISISMSRACPVA